MRARGFAGQKKKKMYYESMCTSPLIGIKYGVDPSTGKWKIKLKRNITFSLQDYWKRYGQENVVLIPCGHCSQCILSHRKEWAVRCACESLNSPLNCFITLTYDEENIHKTKFNKDDAIKFIKAIRNSGFKCRYFGCGELGSHTLRKHYHIVLFGFMPDDLRYVGDSQSGEAMYESRFLEALWNKGIVKVQLFSPRVAGYVAGYCNKKVGDDDGFLFMSRKPGLGASFLQKKKDIILKYSKIYGDFGSMNIAAVPRYFKKILEKEGYSFYLDIMNECKQNLILSDQFAKARLHGYKNIDEAIFHDRLSNDRKLMKLKRGF